MRIVATKHRMLAAVGHLSLIHISNRQVRSLAGNVQDKVREAGGQVLSTEGEESGEWVLVDLGDIVVHVMQPAIRSYYNLEELWGGKGPARVRKVAAANA